MKGINFIGGWIPVTIEKTNERDCNLNTPGHEKTFEDGEEPDIDTGQKEIKESVRP